MTRKKTYLELVKERHHLQERLDYARSMASPDVVWLEKAVATNREEMDAYEFPDTQSSLGV